MPDLKDLTVPANQRRETFFHQPCTWNALHQYEKTAVHKESSTRFWFGAKEPRKMANGFIGVR